MLKVIPVIIGFVATGLLPLFGEVIEPQKGMFSPLKNSQPSHGKMIRLAGG
jgi:hypothetical protein